MQYKMSKDEFRERVLADQWKRKQKKKRELIKAIKQENFEYDGYRHDLRTKSIRKAIGSKTGLRIYKGY